MTRKSRRAPAGREAHSAPRLGAVQMRIMQVLWQREAATAREITDALNGTRDAPTIAHSTVQTLLRQLEDKGAVAHDVDGRAWVFHAVYRRSEVAVSATRDLLARVFGDSVSGLMAHLLQHEKISDKELARLREMIEEASRP